MKRNSFEKGMFSIFMMLICLVALLPCRKTYAATSVNISDKINEAIEEQLVTKVNGIPVDDKVIVETRLQSAVTLDDGTEKQIYIADATSTFETVIEKNGEVSIEPRASVSERTLSEYSDTYEDWLQLKTTIYYETGEYNNIGYIKLNKVTTKVNYIGGNVKSNLLKVRYGYYGYNLDTELYSGSVVKTKI